MRMLVYVFLLIVGSLLTARSAPVPTQQYMHSAVLDEDGNYTLYWSFNATSIVFETHVKTTGWIGLGISPNGGMPGADIAVGWVDDSGMAFFKDRHATAKARPIVDPHQDWFLITSRKEQGYTILKFTRLLDTKDCEHDRPITKDTLRLIWAYSTVLPPPAGDISYHGNRRGSKSINLLEPSQNKGSLIPASAIRQDFLNPNVTLPSETTTYWCQVFSAPQLDRKHHMVKFGPVIQKENKAVVHHLLLYACYSPLKEDTVGKGYMCYNNTMPAELGECRHPMAVWAVGGDDFYFPENVGFALGGPGDPTFFVLEMHYDNPQGRADIKDSSGMAIWYTPDLRANDVGILESGYAVADYMVIPPGQSSFQITGVCTSECTNASLPETGIKAFAYMLHTHLLGHKINLRQYRGRTLLAELGRDDQYDFNYQQTRLFAEDKVIKPGDSLVVDCFYNSASRQQPTFGGLPTHDEMCLAYIYYYPRADLSFCQSVVPPHEEVMALGIDPSPLSFNMINQPNYWANAMKNVTWTSAMVNALQQQQFKSNNYIRCQKKDFTFPPAFEPPNQQMHPSYIGAVTDPVQDCMSSNNTMSTARASTSDFILPSSAPLTGLAFSPLALIVIQLFLHM